MREELVEVILCLFQERRYIDIEQNCTGCPNIKFYPGTKEDGVIISPNEYNCDSYFNPYDVGCRKYSDIHKEADKVADIVEHLISKYDTKQVVIENGDVLTRNQYNDLRKFCEIPSDGLTDDIIELICDIIEISDVIIFDVTPVSKREVLMYLDHMIEDADGNYCFTEDYFESNMYQEKLFIYSWLKEYQDIYKRVSDIIESLRDIERD